MLKLGVIGLGPVWETYRTTLTQLRHPLQVSACYEPDPVAAEKSNALRAELATGILALAERSDVQAVLVTDPGWVGAAAIDLLSRCQKPVLITTWLPTDLSQAIDWYAATEQRGVTLMPAMWRRFMPTTMRLKELLATELGEPLEVSLPVDFRLFATATQMTEAAIGWLDLVWYLVRREPLLETVARVGSESRIVFPPRQPQPVEGGAKSTRRACRVGVSWQFASEFPSLREILGRGTHQDAGCCAVMKFDEQPIPQLRLICERGTATLLDRTTIRWQQNGSEPITEQLTSDRPERLIMLDHFSRRAVGGLIPVADFNDIARVLRLLDVSLC